LNPTAGNVALLLLLLFDFPLSVGRDDNEDDVITAFSLFDFEAGFMDLINPSVEDGAPEIDDNFLASPTLVSFITVDINELGSIIDRTSDSAVWLADCFVALGVSPLLDLPRDCFTITSS
jgi:hypothetical protein